MRLCDGHVDCIDSSDEFDCKHSKKCHEFTCKNGHCIINEWVCDGANDCMDNSDEENCTMTVDEKCNLNDGLFPCKDMSMCLKSELVCNNVKNCADGSDEGKSCLSKEANCVNAKCSHACINTPDGPFCACPTGNGRVSNTTCVDVDECHLLHHLCSQKCINHPGSYECACAEGYELQKDNHTCKSKDEETVLVFCSEDSVLSYLLREKKLELVSNTSSLTVGVNYDGRYVYWTQMKLGEEVIVKSLLDGSKKQILVNTGLDMPEDLAVDWSTGNIYFTDSVMDHIGVCNREIHCTVLISKHIDQPRAIVLHPLEGLMFWTDWGEAPAIAKAKMDGSDDVNIVDTNIVWPNGLTIDYPSERLYWVDGKISLIESVKLDGSHRIKLLEGVGHPYSIAVFEDTLYWSDWGLESLQSCNKRTGKDRRMLISSSRIYGLHIFNPVMSSKKNHACDYIPCSHICLLNGPNSYTCACPEGQILASNGKSCKGLIKDKYLIAGTENTLVTLHHQTLGRNNMVYRTLPNIQIDGIVYDPNMGRVIVYDNFGKFIYSIENFSDMPKITILVDRGIGQIEGMDIDHVTNTLYWCDSHKRTLEVLSLYTHQRAVVIKELNGDVIISVALAPDYGLMFLALRSSDDNIKVIKMGMNGKTTPVHMIQHGIKGPIVKLVYDRLDHSLFMSDSGGRKILSIQIDDSHRQEIVHPKENPGSISIIGPDIFITIENSKTIYWMKKIPSGEPKRQKKTILDLSFPVNQLHLAAVDQEKLNTNLEYQHTCVENHAICSHVCLQGQILQSEHVSNYQRIARLKFFTCLCPEDMIMDVDNRTCKSMIQCDDTQFTCTRSNACVEKSKVCDGKVDCRLGEDEEKCIGHSLTCFSNQFRCEDGTCIALKNKCDKIYDCPDKSDEENCKDYVPENHCKSSQYECKSGQCLDFSSRCDGFPDCPDNDDEKDCEKQRCSKDSFQCNSGNCIPGRWQCDGSIDCQDGSDEHNNCSYNKPCNAGMFRCQSGFCVDGKLRCDKIADCEDGSDELNCPSPTDLKQSENECLDNEYSCSTVKLCLPFSARCNSTKECPKGEDEMDCDPLEECRNDSEFKCHSNGKCIPSKWRCDKEPDCEDSSDEFEKDCLEFKNITSKVKMLNPNLPISSGQCDGEFHCHSGECIDYSQLCDGSNNCEDGSDEGGQCYNSCKLHNCEYDCINSPDGGICKCGKDKRLSQDGHSCESLPPACLNEPPPCHHICTDTKNSYFCGCFDGYSLRVDRKSCKANGEPMSLIFYGNGDLRELSLHNQSVNVHMLNNSMKPTGFDVHTKKRLIFYTNSKVGKLYQQNLMDKSLVTVATGGKPTLLALDWVTENVYFIKQDANATLNVCHMTKGKCALLADLGSDRDITAIAIDPINRLLFYASTKYNDMSSQSIIHKMNLDGTHETILIDTNLMFCSGLAVDFEKRLLYFADKPRNKIESINYEGSSRNLIIHDNAYANKPIDLEIFEDSMYFLQAGTTKIVKCQLYDQRKCTAFNLRVFDVDMFSIDQSNKQKAVADECELKNCRHLCVQAPHAMCLCNDGSSVNESEECSNTQINTFNFTDENVLKKGSETSNGAASTIVILFAISFFIFGSVLLYRYQKNRLRKANQQNLAVQFQNPGLGGDMPDFRASLGGLTSKFPSLIRD